MPIRKKLGQLIKEKHWSVMGLAKSLNITKEHIIKWEKSNKKWLGKFNVWSLYYRSEIVWFIVGFILGVIVI